MVTDDTRRYLFDAVDLRVRSGFGSSEEVVSGVAQLVEDEVGPAPALVEELEAHARRRLEEQRAEEDRWTEDTTNDAIDRAWEELNAAGIVALQNAGYTMSDGWEDANDAAADSAVPPRGATFYHGQDLERGVRGEGLHLAFGAYEEGAGHEAASLAVAREVCAALDRHGVPVEWNGRIDSRIRVLPFAWRKRRATVRRPEPASPDFAGAWCAGFPAVTDSDLAGSLDRSIGEALAAAGAIEQALSLARSPLDADARALATARVAVEMRLAGAPEARVAELVLEAHRAGGSLGPWTFIDLLWIAGAAPPIAVPLRFRARGADWAWSAAVYAAFAVAAREASREVDEARVEMARRAWAGGRERGHAEAPDIVLGAELSRLHLARGDHGEARALRTEARRLFMEEGTARSEEDYLPGGSLPRRALIRAFAAAGEAHLLVAESEMLPREPLCDLAVALAAAGRDDDATALLAGPQSWSLVAYGAMARATAGAARARRWEDEARQRAATHTEEMYAEGLLSKEEMAAARVGPAWTEARRGARGAARASLADLVSAACDAVRADTTGPAHAVLEAALSGSCPAEAEPLPDPWRSEAGRTRLADARAAWAGAGSGWRDLWKASRNARTIVAAAAALSHGDDAPLGRALLEEVESRLVPAGADEIDGSLVRRIGVDLVRATVAHGRLDAALVLTALLREGEASSLVVRALARAGRLDQARRELDTALRSAKTRPDYTALVPAVLSLCSGAEDLAQRAKAMLDAWHDAGARLSRFVP
jgi:hypothetical protein